MNAHEKARENESEVRELSTVEIEEVAGGFMGLLEAHIVTGGYIYGILKSLRDIDAQ